MLTDKEKRIEELKDIIGDASWCFDKDCDCHRTAAEAEEELEVLEKSDS